MSFFLKCNFPYNRNEWSSQQYVLHSLSLPSPLWQDEGSVPSTHLPHHHQHLQSTYYATQFPPAPTRSHHQSQLPLFSPHFIMIGSLCDPPPPLNKSTLPCNQRRCNIYPSISSLATIQRAKPGEAAIRLPSLQAILLHSVFITCPSLQQSSKPQIGDHFADYLHSVYRDNPEFPIACTSQFSISLLFWPICLWPPSLPLFGWI